MNIIAGLLKNVSPQPSPVSFHPQENSESEANATGAREQGFESVLSNLAQKSVPQISETAANAPQTRAPIGGDKHEADGDAQGGEANSEQNANAILAKVAGALQSGKDSNSTSANSLSLLSSVLAGTDEEKEQGNSAAIANGLTNKAAVLSELDAQASATTGSMPNQSAVSKTFFTQQRPAPSGQSATAAKSNGASAGVAQEAATQWTNGAGIPARAPIPTSNGVKPNVTLVPNTNANAASESSAGGSNDTQVPSSPVNNTLQQSRANTQAPQPHDANSSTSNAAPQPAAAPNIAAMANAVAASAALAANLPTSNPAPTSATNGQTGTRTSGTERQGAKQQKAPDQSAPSTQTSGADGAIDLAAQAALAAQVPISFEAGAGGQPKDMGSAQQNLPQPHISTSALAAASASASDGLDSVAPSDIKVSVLSTETHFEPAQRLSPVQQIADAVFTALPMASASAPSTASADDSEGFLSANAANVSSADATAQTGPVKVLNLQLEPPSLGTVTISLNLSEGSLTVQMAASQASTVNIIERDKNSLSEQLRDSGYSIAGVAVTLGTHQPASTANDGSAAQGQAGQNFSQNNGQAMSSDGGSSNANGNGQNGGNRSLSQPGGGSSDSFTSARDGGASSGDLYI